MNRTILFACASSLALMGCTSDPLRPRPSHTLTRSFNPPSPSASVPSRIRAAVMTSATTILALLPVLTSSGRGSDIMIPMAIPTFGGMAVASLTWFVVPILYCGWAELRLRFSNTLGRPGQNQRSST